MQISNHRFIEWGRCADGAGVEVLNRQIGRRIRVLLLLVFGHPAFHLSIHISKRLFLNITEVNGGLNSPGRTGNLPNPAHHRQDMERHGQVGLHTAEPTETAITILQLPEFFHSHALLIGQPVLVEQLS